MLFNGHTCIYVCNGPVTNSKLTVCISSLHFIAWKLNIEKLFKNYSSETSVLIRNNLILNTYTDVLQSELSG